MPEITKPIEKLPNPSKVALIPRREPWSPLPAMINERPKNNGQIDNKALIILTSWFNRKFLKKNM